jgi:hypothetical protein
MYVRTYVCYSLCILLPQTALSNDLTILVSSCRQLAEMALMPRVTINVPLLPGRGH